MEPWQIVTAMVGSFIATLIVLAASIIGSRSSSQSEKDYLELVELEKETES